MMQAGVIAPEFCADFYRQTQADLRDFTEDQLADHYREHGKNEGRCASPADFRDGFIAQINHCRSILEIGPAVRPTLSGSNVQYFDIADRAGLIARACRENYDISRCPNFIDYVSPEGDLGVVDVKFDAIFSSHCVEHQPDLIRHLHQVASILNPGGCYYLMIPDKRYCFDNLLPASDIKRIRRAHQEQRKTHIFESILEHVALTTHNSANRHWEKDHVDLHMVQNQAERIIKAREMFEQANGGYIDVHAWQFTPDSFRDIIEGLSGIISLRVNRVYNTLRNTNEFGAVLCL